MGKFYRCDLCNQEAAYLIDIHDQGRIICVCRACYIDRPDIILIDQILSDEQYSA